MATMTAGQKRAQAKAEYDAFLAACPSRQLLDRVSDKWVTLVLSALGSGPDCAGEPRPMRYSELARTLAGVSPKMLSQTLRRLQRDGLVRRTVYPVVPPHTEYSLTDLGESLMTPLSILCSWGAQHLPQIDAARRSAAEPAPRVLETVP